MNRDDYLKSLFKNLDTGGNEAFVILKNELKQTLDTVANKFKQYLSCRYDINDMMQDIDFKLFEIKDDVQDCNYPISIFVNNKLTNFICSQVKKCSFVTNIETEEKLENFIDQMYYYKISEEIEDKIDRSINIDYSNLLDYVIFNNLFSENGKMMDVFSKIPERSMDIIILYYNLNCTNNQYTYDSLGKTYNISRARIREIVNKGLCVMRSKLYKYNYLADSIENEYIRYMYK